MKCVRKEPAEAIACSRDNEINVMKFIESRIDSINGYGKRIKMILGRLGGPIIKADGYFVIDNGFIDFYTKKEFNKMYKQLWQRQNSKYKE